MTEIITIPEYLSQNPYNVLRVAFVIFLFVRVIPGLSYPFELFFTMIHELGHVIATGISKGKILGFRVFSDKSGVAHKEDGSNFLIFSAGYLGVTLFSAGLILLTKFPQFAPYVVGGLGIILLFLLVGYGKQTKPDNPKYKARHVITGFVGFGSVAVLVATAWLADPVWSALLLNLLAISGAYQSMHDLNIVENIVHQAQIVGQSQDSDPEVIGKLLEKAPILKNPMFWVTTWKLLSLVILAAAFWYTWLRDLQLLPPSLLASS